MCSRAGAMTAEDFSFAIAVPVGAWHPWLEDVFASLAAQEGPLRVSLLDASGDPRVKALADRWDHLFAFRQHQSDNGQADAIAKGWEATQGTILGWLNADDILFPDTLAKVRTRFSARDHPDVVYGQSTIVDRLRRLRSWQYGVEPPTERLAHAAVISQPSCFFRREACAAAGGLDRSLHYTMDWDLFARLYRSGARFAFIDEALSQVLWDLGTKTSSLNACRKSEIRRMFALYPQADDQPGQMRGFAVQNLIDRAPGPLRRTLLRLLHRRSALIHGLRPDGWTAERFSLPFVHYRAAPVTVVEVSFLAKVPPSCSATFGGAPCAVEVKGKRLAITLPEPFAGSNRGVLHLEMGAPGYRFHHATMLEI